MGQFWAAQEETVILAGEIGTSRGMTVPSGTNFAGREVTFQHPESQFRLGVIVFQLHDFIIFSDDAAALYLFTPEIK